MKIKFRKPLDFESGRRFQLYCLFASVSIFLLAMVDNIFYQGLFKASQSHERGSNQVIFIVTMVVSGLIMSILPYILATIAVRKKSWIPLLLLAVFAALSFLGFLGDMSKFGFFYHRTIDALIPAVIIGLSFLSLLKFDR